MFDIIGSVIGVLFVFNMGVYVGKKYYVEYMSFFKKLVKKVKELFTRTKKK